METDRKNVETDWESDLAGLLTELSDVQDEMLEVLARKRDLMAATDADGMVKIEADEQDVLAKLEACQQRRTELLERADRDGLPSGNIKSLVAALPGAKSADLGKQVKHATHRSRLLQQSTLTNWVLAQQTLLHVSQMLQIIATGGRGKPTYGKGESISNAGSLVDRAA